MSSGQGSARGLWVVAVVASLALSAAQFWLIGRVELTFDEAYYTLWSRNLAWGYLDHPPMVAAWIRASTTLFGPSEFGVRALDAGIFAVLPAAVGWIAWRLFRSARTAALAALLWVSMPLVAGAPIVTPDAPLLVFWTLALAGLVEVFRGRPSGWALVGVASGLGLLSKFTMAFLGAGIGLALVATPSLRIWFRRPGPWAAALGALAIFSPFLAWNAVHDWATFGKQLGRVPARGLAPRYLLEFLASQIGLSNPATLAAAAFGQRRPGPLDADGEARRLLLATVAPAALYFLAHSLHDRVQGNWLAPLYPEIAILAAHAASSGKTWVGRAVRLAPPLGLGAIALAYFHVGTGLPELGPADPLARIGGWRDLAREVDARAKDAGASYILARGYAATALLTYYGDGALPVAQRDERRRWLFEPPPTEAAFASPGVAFGEVDGGYAAELARQFRHVEPIAKLARRSGGRDVGSFLLYLVRDPIGPVPEED